MNAKLNLLQKEYHWFNHVPAKMNKLCFHSIVQHELETRISTIIVFITMSLRCQRLLSFPVLLTVAPQVLMEECKCGISSFTNKLSATCNVTIIF